MKPQNFNTHYGVTESRRNSFLLDLNSRFSSSFAAELILNLIFADCQLLIANCLFSRKSAANNP